MFGKGVTRYIVPPATIGADSCPRFTPVEKAKAGRRRATFPASISSSPLKRVLAKFFAGIVHCPSSAGAALPAGGSVVLTVEYFHAVRGTAIDPEVSVTPVDEPQPHPRAGEAGFAVDRCELLDDGSVLIEFTASPGSDYEVQYSDDTTDWKISPVGIRAAGNRVQWIDHGPPRTDSPPSGRKSRFYRVREIERP